MLPDSWSPTAPGMALLPAELRRVASEMARLADRLELSADQTGSAMGMLGRAFDGTALAPAAGDVAREVSRCLGGEALLLRRLARCLVIAAEAYVETDAAVATATVLDGMQR